MKVQTYRPRVQNKTVARRQAGRRPGGSASAKTAARASADGSGILWGLLLFGALIGGIFIYSVRTQNKALMLSQTEASLKRELGDLANRQRHEMARQNGALMPEEAARAATRSGLVQPVLSRQGAERGPAAPADERVRSDSPARGEVSRAARGEQGKVAGRKPVAVKSRHRAEGRAMARTGERAGGRAGDRAGARAPGRKNAVNRVEGGGRRVIAGRR